MKVITSFLAIGFLIAMQSCYSQRIIFECNFNISDCDFVGDSLSSVLDREVPEMPGSFPPTRPLSDAASISQPTEGSNELCDLPYEYPKGDWMMHFCTKTQNTLLSPFICPVESGFGFCVYGLYAFVTVNTSEIYNATFSRQISDAVAGLQCLEYYYYLLNDSYSPNIKFKWQDTTLSNTAQIITIEQPQEENKWYQRRISFTTNSKNYILSFEFNRESSSSPYTFAIDEIKITEGSCDSISDITTIKNFVTSESSEETATTWDGASAKSTSDIDVTLTAAALSSLTTSDTWSSGMTLSSNITSTIEISTSTKTKDESSKEESNLALVLGLSLGIGILLLILLIVGVIYYLKVVKPKTKVMTTDKIGLVQMQPTNNASEEPHTK